MVKSSIEVFDAAIVLWATWQDQERPHPEAQGQVQVWDGERDGNVHFHHR